MKTLLHSRLYASVLAVLVAGCSAQVNDIFKTFLDSSALQSQTAITLLSNSTTELPVACELSNEIVIQKSVPAGAKLYCAEEAALGENLVEGLSCPGGVTISPVSVSSEFRECSQITVCGVGPSSVMSVGKRADGGTIDELRFSNLPWGCDSKLKYTVDPEFKEANVSTLNLVVQPSECPFCPRTNSPSCLPCRDLTSDEKIRSGQVIKRCSAGNCKSCAVIGLSSQSVEHGQGYVYYKAESGGCTDKCGTKSLLRICNDGLWEGDPSYRYPQCFDSACGCTLPGDPISYAHRASKVIYKTATPDCGVKCADNSLLVKCNDGLWEAGNPLTPLTAAELAVYPAKTCTDKVCNCLRTGRDPVGDGMSKMVYAKKTVTCTEKCADFTGTVSCEAGKLKAVNPLFLDYGYDSCMQEDCGCRVDLADNKFVLLANGGSTTIYKYAQNTVDVPDACTNPAHKLTISCANKVLSPAYNKAVFKFNTCTEVPLACTFTDGAGAKVDVAHNAKLTVSVTNTPRCGEACQNLELTCQNRVFKKLVNGNLVDVPPAELSTYKVASPCTPKNCDCNVNGHIIGYNQTLENFYTTNKVTDCNINGCSQASASITCTENGPVTSKGDSASLYKYRTCEVVLCECNAPWGGTIQNGKTVKVFNKSQATCSAPLACEDAASFQQLTCSNGALTPYNPSAYPFLSCAPPICDCTFGNQKIPFGQTLTVYEYDRAPDGTLCDDYDAVLTCNPGGVWSGGDLAKYKFTQCTDLSDDGQGGGSGGGNGNDEGPGSGIKRRMDSGGGGGGGGGGPCLDVRSCRINNVSTEPVMWAKDTCILPWGGGEAEFYSDISAFDSQCVTTPDRCSKHRIVRTCQMHNWTGEDRYRYPTCEEKAVCP